MSETTTKSTVAVECYDNHASARRRALVALAIVALAVIAFCAWWGGPLRAACEVTWWAYEAMQALADGAFAVSFALMEAL